ncbi:MAG: NTP transferase domain-containing protein, partial [Planctomycetes bacterium]|nr:NTP transferase domain-containing protein [Planctomycetota bacterium]
LPGKALLEIGQKPLLGHVIDRAAAIPGVNRVTLATSRGAENDPLEVLAVKRGVFVLRGDEDNVVERLALVARELDANHVIRLTGDNPMLDPGLAEALLKAHLRAEADFSCLTGAPVGAGCDIFSRRALEETYARCNGAAMQDHVDLFVLHRPEEFRLYRLHVPGGWSRFRLTVDYPEDLERVRAVERAAGGLRCQSVFDLLAVAEKSGLWPMLVPQGIKISRQNQETAELVQAIAEWEDYDAGMVVPLIKGN